MRNYLLMLIVMLVCAGCGETEKQDRTVVKKTVATQPVLKVYNMGGAPQNIVMQLTERLKDVYDNTVFAGDLPLVDSALIKNDRKGQGRYWNSVMMNRMKKITNRKKEISLVVVNGEICNWTKNGSHANLGMSLLGSHISLVSYKRLKVNKLDNVDDMLKVAIHELGHSVGSLVKGRKDLRFHCPDNKCMMFDASNKYPYRNISGFCNSCDSVMHARGFKTENLHLK